MFARLTLLEIDTVRVSMNDALDRFRSEIAPHLREQPGYCGVFVLSIEGDHNFYGEALGSFATFFRSAPGRDRYEVVYVDEPTRTG
jgi:hypothetical protein